jgi:hypothetical protein
MFLGIYTKKRKSGYNRDTCTPVFITVIFTIAKKLWHIYTMEFYSAIRKDDK